MIIDPLKHSVTVNNKKHFYVIKPIDKEAVHFECLSIGMSQKFLVEDLPDLLVHLPETIQEILDIRKKHEEVIRFRVSAQEKKEIQKKSIQAGYSNVSAFLRALALEA